MFDRYSGCAYVSYTPDFKVSKVEPDNFSDGEEVYTILNI